MIPFLAPLALKLLPVRRALAKVPRVVWYALAAALALFLVVRWHNNTVADARKAGELAGYTRAMAKVEKQARELQAKAEAASARINAEIRSKTDEENRRTAGVADDLRLSGPGKARCNSPAVPSGPGGRVASGGSANAPADRVPDEDRIALPYSYTVNQAEVCDINRTEVLAWREWHKRFTAEWAKLQR